MNYNSLLTTEPNHGGNGSGIDPNNRLEKNDLRALAAHRGRNMLVLVSIVTITLIIDTEIGNVADFIPDFLISAPGIVLYVGIGIIFAVGQHFILGFVKQNNRRRGENVPYIRATHVAVTAAQYVLTAIIALTIVEILAISQYQTVLLAASILISYALVNVMLGLLAKGFFSWYRSASEKSPMVLIFGFAMAATVVNLVGGLIYFLGFLLLEQPEVATPETIAAFPQYDPGTLLGEISTWYQVAGGVAFVVTWIGTVMLLRPYTRRLGKIKFWTIMGIALAYYIVQIPLFMLGWYTPTENTDQDVMNNIILFAAASIFIGIVFGAAFLSVARTLPRGSPLAQHMRIAAYGLLLLYVAGAGFVSQAAYPPYGLASVSFVGLSSYLIYSGLYSSAVTVSQDMALRQSIKRSVLEQSRLLDSIGTAQMEKELQNRVMGVARKASAELEKESGVKVSMTEDDMKEYMEVLASELHTTRTEA